MTQSIYLGPPIDGLAQNTVFIGGVPVSLAWILDANPLVEYLIVPIEATVTTMIAIDTEGTREHEAFRLLSGYVPTDMDGSDPNPGGGNNGGGSSGPVGEISIEKITTLPAATQVLAESSKIVKLAGSTDVTPSPDRLYVCSMLGDGSYGWIMLG
ncbi:hypothetical protein SAMN05216312_102232 [Cohnella sp. OV330]|uniref:hypothetical protein n=1 Tax=Cohnella sp. OV330 TaxID=1855288 RepID=UPI0008E36998|nr:hypothetical protein [Cohnella sp. OV330]SFA91822.1 hypothetical protein SAMN05216312_102232 [Cohnella sp. OV330]